MNSCHAWMATLLKGQKKRKKKDAAALLMTIA
jgi:hypothetical protein